ncbi:cAMP-activated global transcriptional regulator CRP [Halochromatium glycolicum]|jgi:CRP/FNR family cyclic AMP-dependent transcriptional regulator|uniref:Transcriptional regulator Crp n=1 Tax=Halochromatium glycolicum TaxID=85075 RepID=A0AAJ0U4C2_9GAMM|nr:cAMP-activated global transcriptional regulator CRP [Halochromatium glycolicum]MBK1704878.1 transcriptional regulator Crp [Halochromatium glycolicum]
MLIKPPQDPPWLEPFLSHCHTKHYEKHVDFIRRGEPAESLYYLVEGSVTALLEDDDRHELTLAYINKGEFIGEMGLFQDQTTRSVIVRTREPCKVAEVSYVRVQQLLERELREHALGLMFAIGGQLAQRLRQTSRQVGDLAFLDVTGRIAGALLQLCKQPDAMTHPDGMQIRITRQDLGRMVGCSREMAGRVLKALEEKGHISVSGKTIVVFGTR